MNHVMAECLQRLYFEKGSLWQHLKGFSDVRASFLGESSKHIRIDSH